jgi:tetrahydromethanopterin S-methyltransferase subunit G
MKKTAKKKKIAKVHKPVRSSEVPATKAMLDELEQKLTHEMASVKLEVKSVKSELTAKIGQVEAKVEQLDAKVESVLAAVHRVGLLVEEQNARNKFVLDGYTSLNDRLEKVERKIDENV